MEDFHGVSLKQILELMVHGLYITILMVLNLVLKGLMIVYLGEVLQ